MFYYLLHLWNFNLNELVVPFSISLVVVFLIVTKPFNNNKGINKQKSFKKPPMN